MKRYLILLSALAMQICLGATYSWSVFVRPLRELTGLSQGLAQMPFTVFYFAFPATMIFAGMLLAKTGPRRSAVMGGILFGGGWLLASLGDVHFAFVVLGIGLVAGIGVGFAYIVPIAVLIQWFPRHKGLVTGFAVAGFGGGAALVGQLGGLLLHDPGMSPFMIFRLFGIVFLLLVSGAGLVMEFAPDAQRGTAVRLTARDIVGRKEFRALYGAMFAGLAAGFAVNANMKEFFPGSATTGVMAVSLFALANALGRIIWGAIFDRFSSAAVIRLNLLIQAAVLIAGNWLPGTSQGFLAFAFMAGFNYGGVLVVYASTAARLWGSHAVGQVYGLLFSANILAAPSAILAGFSYDALGSFAVTLVLLSGLLLAGAVLVAKRSVLINGG